jgi:ParB-like chromosome segregation protein Spo0J
VRKNGTTPKGEPIVEVIDGRQRVRACREANRRRIAEGLEPWTVPAKRKRGSDADMMAMMIITNELRFADSPMDRARKIQRLVDLHGDENGIDEAVEVFGLTRTTVKQYLTIMDLHETVQKAVDSGELAIVHAVELQTLKREEQPAALETMREAGTMKGASAAEAVQTLTGKGRGKTGEEGEVKELPTKPWLRRLQAELEAMKNDGEDVEQPLQVLKLVLEGKKPRGGIVSTAWSAVRKRFSRGKAEE